MKKVYAVIVYDTTSNSDERSVGWVNDISLGLQDAISYCECNLTFDDRKDAEDFMADCETYKNENGLDWASFDIEEFEIDVKEITNYSIKRYPANLQVTVNYKDGDCVICDYSTDWSCCIGEYTREEWKEGLKEEHPEWNDEIYEDILNALENTFNVPFFKNIRTRIGSRIKELRTERGMTQQQLADKAGITKANVCNIEGGRYSVGIDVLYRIAEALGVTIELIDK